MLTGLEFEFDEAGDVKLPLGNGWHFTIPKEPEPDPATYLLLCDPGYEGHRRHQSERARLIRQEKPRPIKRGSRQ